MDSSDSTGTQTREPGGVQISGTVEDGYEPVRDAFAANFAERGEIGASFAVVAGGQPVVNLWAGTADPAGTRPWQAGTLTNVWSTTKAMTSLCVAILMDRAGLDPDTPVARYWPEFAAAGKDGIPLRWVLAHRSGLSGLATPVTVADYLDWEKITSLLAAQPPLWEPGTASGYHAITFGYLVGEVVRRITGQTLGQFFAAEVAGPLGADFFIGLPEADLPRCANLLGVRPSEEEQSALATAYANAHPAALAALLNPPLTGDEANDPAWRQAEIPAANGHGTALALATIMGAVADGSQRLITTATMEAMREGQGTYQDLVLGFPLEFGLGVARSGPEQHFGPNPAAFGHDGFGGSAACADPEAGLAMAYVMNRMGMNLADDPRKMALLDAVYASVR
jgi:CubicO group peptidase (beta-lactamase class C family)